MGHSVSIPLDNTYFTPTLDRIFAEFKKAIQELTIDPTIRQKALIAKQKEEISELEKDKRRIDKLEDALSTLMFIANGKDWGYTDGDINKLWKEFNPKFNEILAEAKKNGSKQL